MTLVATLTPIESSNTGDFQATTATVADISAGIKEPEVGWLLCNGTFINTEYVNPGDKYNALFQKIGTSYNNVGDGAGFRLPLLVDGRSPVGRGVSAFTTIGAKGGAKQVTLTLAQLSLHVHNYVDNTFPVGGGSGYGRMEVFEVTDPVALRARTTVSAGGAGAHENMPLHQVVEAWLIKY